MESTMKFYYTKEFWYISAFLNSTRVNEENIAKKISTILYLLKERLSNLKESDFGYLERFPNAEENKRNLIEMGNSISIECEWVPLFSGFSYTSEKRDFTKGSKPELIVFDSLGYFKFNVEYFKGNNFNSKNRIQADKTVFSFFNDRNNVVDLGTVNNICVTIYSILL